jgi:hypothetical protein
VLGTELRAVNTADATSGAYKRVTLRVTAAKNAAAASGQQPTSIDKIK